MKHLLKAVAAFALLAGISGAMAQPRHDDHHDMRGPSMGGPAMHGPAMQGPAMHGPAMGRRHPEWRKGSRIGRNDWNRGSRVDYRARHLSRPPRGYEWRQVDGNYVLAAAATGLIASIILANQ